MSGAAHTARTRLAHMNLIIALCLLCCCVAPHACRSVDARDSPSEDLEPLARHHHEGNIAELLIPLLERSLAQSEARSNERQLRRAKAGKKVIQVLPYRGSQEHKRKGWRKLNSHKKQVVEITPLHGKNRAKPLAYILSAAKSHGERAQPDDDVSSISASDLEQDKSSSEEQQSSEEVQQTLGSEDVSDNGLRSGADASDSPGASSITQSSENVSSKESKDLSASDKESSAELTKESVSDTDSDDKSEAQGKIVVVEESTEDIPTAPKSVKHHVLNYKGHVHKFIAPVTGVDKAVTAEETVTLEDVAVTAEERAAAVEAVTVEESVTAEETSTAEELATADNDATIEEKAASAEDKTSTVDEIAKEASTAEERATSAEEAATADEEMVTAEEEGATAEEATTAEDKATTAEEAVIVEDAVTSEEAGIAQEAPAAEDYTVTGEAVTVEEAALTEEDAVVEERAATGEDSESPPHKNHALEYPLDRGHHVHNEDISDINNLLGKLNLQAKETNDESEASPEQTRGEFIENDIVISHGHHDVDSAEKSFSKLFNARARDIIELIQSSVEASTAPHRDCKTEPVEKHNHDHKSYRLSFLFNK